MSARDRERGVGMLHVRLLVCSCARGGAWCGVAWRAGVAA